MRSSEIEWRMWLLNTKSRSSAGPDMSQCPQIIGGPIIGGSGIQETGNDYLEDIHNDGKMKLSGDSGQFGKE